MKTKDLLYAFTVLGLVSAVWTAMAQDTAFTYQGYLASNNAPVTDTIDFVFRMVDSPDGEGEVSLILTNLATPVNQGVFLVTLDFGSGVFDGTPLWLEISVRSEAGDFTTLAPRQAITAAPYAQWAAAASTANNVDGANITGTIADQVLPADVALLSTTADFSGAVTAPTFSGDGSGLVNLSGANVVGAVSNAVNAATAASVPWSALPGSVLTNAAAFDANGAAAALAWTNGLSLWIDSTYGNDAHDGKSAASALRSLAALNAANKGGYTIHFAPGVYVLPTEAPGGTNFSLQISNNVVLAQGATIEDAPDYGQGNANPKIVALISGNCYWVGGTVAATNTNDICVPVGICSHSNAPATIYINGLSTIGYTDGLTMQYGLPFESRIDLLVVGWRAVSSWDAWCEALSPSPTGDGTAANSKFSFVGCDVLCDQALCPASLWPTVLAGGNLVRGLSCGVGATYINGSVIRTYASTGNALCVPVYDTSPSGGSVVNLAGSTLESAVSNQTSVACYCRIGGRARLNVLGHPYPEALMTTTAQGVISYSGWDDATFAGAFVGNGVNLTNLSAANLRGTLPPGLLPPNVPLLTGTNLTLSGGLQVGGGATVAGSLAATSLRLGSGSAIKTVYAGNGSFASTNSGSLLVTHNQNLLPGNQVILLSMDGKLSAGAITASPSVVDANSFRIYWQNGSPSGTQTFSYVIFLF